MVVLIFQGPPKKGPNEIGARCAVGGVGGMFGNRLQVGQAPVEVIVVYEENCRPLLHSLEIEKRHSTKFGVFRAGFPRNFKFEGVTMHEQPVQESSRILIYHLHHAVNKQTTVRFLHLRQLLAK